MEIVVGELGMSCLALWRELAFFLERNFIAVHCHYKQWLFLVSL